MIKIKITISPSMNVQESLAIQQYCKENHQAPTSMELEYGNYN